VRRCESMCQRLWPPSSECARVLIAMHMRCDRALRGPETVLVRCAWCGHALLVTCNNLNARDKLISAKELVAWTPCHCDRAL
jgi:hypothetical protein